MLWAILNKSRRQHPTRHQLYGHLPPIMKTIQVRWIRHAVHCWRSRDELISDVLLCNPTYGRAKAGQPAQTYIQQQCEDTGWSPEDLPGAMNDREKWRERVRDIRACGTTWWWWPSSRNVIFYPSKISQNTLVSLFSLYKAANEWSATEIPNEDNDFIKPIAIRKPEILKILSRLKQFWNNKSDIYDGVIYSILISPAKEFFQQSFSHKYSFVCWPQMIDSIQCWIWLV